MKLYHILIPALFIHASLSDPASAEGPGGGTPTNENPNDFLSTAAAPEKISITDTLGVSVLNGTFLHDLPSVSLRGAAPNDLELHFRDTSGTPPVFNTHPKNPDYVTATAMRRQHNRFGQIVQHRLDQYTWTSIVSVTFDNSSEDFTVAGTPLVPSGSALSYDSTAKEFTYTLKDGTKAYFSEVVNGIDLFPTSGRYGGILTKVTRPSGVTENHIYQISNCFFGSNACIRLKSILSNNGDQLFFEYVYDGASITGSSTAAYTNSVSWRNIKKITAINRSVDFCQEIASSCQLSNAWPSISISPKNNTSDDSLSNYFDVTNSAGQLERVILATSTDTVLKQNPARILYPNDSREDLNIQYYDDKGYLSVDGPAYLKVKSIEHGGHVWNYGYSVRNRTSYPSDSFAPNGTGLTITATDPVGNATIYESTTFHSNSSIIIRPSLLLTKMTDPLGRVTQYIYDTETRRLKEFHKPQGDGERYAYDSRGNLITKTSLPKPGSGLSEKNRSALFPSTCTFATSCNKPLWTRDYTGSQTDYTYATSHGGQLSELRPAPLAGAARPLKLFTYQQRFAWIKNASGTLIQAISPIWLPETMTECQTTPGSNTPACDNAMPKTLTIYEYGTEGTRESLLVKGIAVSDGQTTLRTCFKYDFFNRKISETKPSANILTCP